MSAQRRNPSGKTSFGTVRPFTVIVCTACAADGDAAVPAELRATIRRSAHGMLVTTGCLLAPGRCTQAVGRVTVAVQPCTVDRRPEGRVRWVGPIDGAGDVRALCRWLERGAWDAPLSTRWDARRHVDSRN
jgi:hypothetical protein